MTPATFNPYTYEAQLCDDDGIVRGGALHRGTDYPCTGHAHAQGHHIRCTSPAHRITPGVLTVTFEGGSEVRITNGVVETRG